MRIRTASSATRRHSPWSIRRVGAMAAETVPTGDHPARPGEMRHLRLDPATRCHAIRRLRPAGA